MNLNLNFNGKTKLKDWWKQIKAIFQQVQTDVNNEISDRTAADNMLQGNINTEVAERKSADNILQNNIASEANFRQISDNALQSGINNEKTARENADNAHKNAVELDHPNGSVTETKLSAAAQAKLNHNNRNVLDGITADRVTKWDAGGEIPEEGVKYHHLSYPLEQNIVQVVRGTVIPGDNGNPGTFVVDPNINDIDFHRGGMFIAEFTGIIEKFTHKEKDYFVVNGDYDSVGADGELQFWLFHINTGITDAGTKDVSPMLQLDGDKYGTKKYNVSDIMDTNNFFEFPGNAGAYIYLTNDTETEISYLYYNDDAGYSFTVPLQPGKAYPCLLLKNATSTIDGSEDGRIYVVGQGGIDHYMIKSAAVQGNNIAPGAVSLEKFATDVQNKITAWDAAANTTIDDLSGVFCHDFGNVVFDKAIDPDWAEPENQYNVDERGILQSGDIVRFKLSSIKSTTGAEEQETAGLSINVGYYSNYLNLISDKPFKVDHNYMAIVSQALTWDDEQGSPGSDGTAYIILDDWKTQGAGGNNDPEPTQRSVTFVVGNIASGHTLGECDYLCDGVADNAEINAAIQALPSGGGTIKILAGEYTLLSSLRLNKPGITLMGDGINTKITLTNTSNNIDVSADNITIKDMALKKGNAINGNPIFAQNVEGLTIDNVNISDCFYSVQLKGVRRSYIKNCTITNSKGGISVGSAYINSAYVPSEQIVVSENFINGITDSGISVNAPSNGVVVSNNNIQDCGTGVSSLINTGTQVSNIIIKSNMCTNNQHYGIRIQAYSSNEGSIADSIHIEGNTCSGSDYGIWIQGYSGMTNFKKSIISNNILADNNNGIVLTGAGDTIINDNLCIRGGGTAADYTSSQSTILLSGCSRCLVGHNMLRGKSYNSTSNTNIVFSENDITTE